MTEFVCRKDSKRHCMNCIHRDECDVANVCNGNCGHCDIYDCENNFYYNPVSPGDGMPYYQGKPVTIIGEDWDDDYHVVMITITDYKTRKTYNKEVDYSSLEWH